MEYLYPRCGDLGFLEEVSSAQTKAGIRNLVPEEAFANRSNSFI